MDVWTADMRMLTRLPKELGAWCFDLSPNGYAVSGGINRFVPRVGITLGQLKGIIAGPAVRRRAAGARVIDTTPASWDTWCTRVHLALQGYKNGARLLPIDEIWRGFDRAILAMRTAVTLFKYNGRRHVCELRDGVTGEQLVDAVRVLLA